MPILVFIHKNPHIAQHYGITLKYNKRKDNFGDDSNDQNFYGSYIDIVFPFHSDM